MTALAHSHDLKVMMHSCGGIRPLIGHLIEAGVDMLAPVQTTAVGMNPAELKREFGDRLVFHGAIDTQRVLPAKPPDEVYAHGVGMIETLGQDGGYVYASCNSLQSDTSVENIDAMYRAAREHKL
jgi:uroporphyrinogen decarboxylase